MNNEIAYLKHIADACAQIEEYIEGKKFQDFKKNQLLQDGVIRQMQIVGQASKLLSANTRKLLKSIDWMGIIGMRNKLVHEYFGVDLKTVWSAAKKDVPELEKAVRSLLEELEA